MRSRVTATGWCARRPGSYVYLSEARWNAPPSTYSWLICTSESSAACLSDCKARLASPFIALSNSRPEPEVKLAVVQLSPHGVASEFMHARQRAHQEETYEDHHSVVLGSLDRGKTVLGIKARRLDGPSVPHLICFSTLYSLQYWLSLR